MLSPGRYTSIKGAAAFLGLCSVYAPEPSIDLGVLSDRLESMGVRIDPSNGMAMIEDVERAYLKKMDGERLAGSAL